MLAPSIFLALVSIARVAVAQIDPESVPKSTRDYWCYQQTTSCPLICLQLPGADGPPLANDCDSDVLDFHCVCSNGMAPNASEYSQTLPYFICTQQDNDCVDRCTGDSKCQAACRQDHPCGAQDPRPPNSSTITAMSATSSTAGASSVVYTGLGDGSAQTGKPKAAAPGRVAIEIGHAYGLGLMIVGFLAGFAILL